MNKKMQNLKNGFSVMTDEELRSVVGGESYPANQYSDNSGNTYIVEMYYIVF